MVADAGEELMLEPIGHEEKVFVSVRLRPLNEKEKARKDESDWECINDKTIIYRNPFPTPDRSLYPTAYTFDRVFRRDCSTRQVYEEGAKEVALSVVSGINSSVFAYGQTSSGKTYTMCGVTEYTVADIYYYMEKHKEREFFLKFSAMEIYNESVRDLLSADSTPLRLLDDPERGTIVEKLTEETLRDWNHFKELLSICEAQRQIGDTALNETSSRSHQILRLTVESSPREFLRNENSSTLAATVNFVDLAGSERASQALSAGARLKEGCHINRSLLTLGTVIRKLSKGRTGHIPFRDSKLTRILQSTLGGNARTAIICTMSPARSHVEQSRNTLLFASCAKEVTTNAQVNVLMSDKALVKHLQRELARLEGELSTGPTSITSDSAALLREKDLEIEELKKEIKELSLQRDQLTQQRDQLTLQRDQLTLQRDQLTLQRDQLILQRDQLTLQRDQLTLQQDQLTLQRDLAQSQLKDLLQVVGNDRISVVSSDDDRQYPKLHVRVSSWEPENPVASIDSQSPRMGVRSFDASQYSDGHSQSNSDDNYIQFSDMDESFRHRDTSPSPSVSIPTYVGTRMSRGETKEQTDVFSEDLCKEVRCIEMEESCGSGYMDSILSSPEKKTGISVLTGVENDDEVNQDSESPPLKDDKESEHANQVSVTQSPDILSSGLPEKVTSISRSLKLTRSKSCESSFMASLSSHWFEKEEMNESTPPCGYEKEFTGRPEGFQRKPSALKYSVHTESLTGDNPQTSAGSATVDDLKVQNIETICNEKDSNINNAVTWTEELSEFQNKSQLADHAVQETEQKSTVTAKTVKDVGLDPMPDDDLESLSNWPSEFGRLQREIIELWNSCNVPLVHRTYFFLQFKGDPKDSIYLEVELRRLSILMDSISQGNQTAGDTSSSKALRRERQWLSKRMQKKFSELERQNLYLRWGIGLDSKDRRLQLAHRLWTDTKNMEHITESANIVAKLVGIVCPEPAFKEMFGLYFTPPRRTSWKFYQWKNSGNPPS